MISSLISGIKSIGKLFVAPFSGSWIHGKDDRNVYLFRLFLRRDFAFSFRTACTAKDKKDKKQDTAQPGVPFFINLCFLCRRPESESGRAYLLLLLHNKIVHPPHILIAAWL